MERNDKHTSQTRQGHYQFLMNPRENFRASFEPYIHSFWEIIDSAHRTKTIKTIVV